MEKVHSIQEVDQFIENNDLALFYISQPGCSVCVSLLPQVEQLLENYPKVQSRYIDASEIREIAGRFEIFTVPVVLLFVEGKEAIRKARFVPLDELEENISKIYRLID